MPGKSFDVEPESHLPAGGGDEQRSNPAGDAYVDASPGAATEKTSDTGAPHRGKARGSPHRDS